AADVFARDHVEADLRECCADRPRVADRLVELLVRQIDVAIVADDERDALRSAGRGEREGQRQPDRNDDVKKPHSASPMNRRREMMSRTALYSIRAVRRKDELQPSPREPRTDRWHAAGPLNPPPAPPSGQRGPSPPSRGLAQSRLR